MNEPFINSALAIVMIFIALPGLDQIVKIEQFFRDGILHIKIPPPAIGGKVVFYPDLFAGQAFRLGFLSQTLHGRQIGELNDHCRAFLAHHENESFTVRHQLLKQCSFIFP